MTLLNAILARNGFIEGRGSSDVGQRLPISFPIT